jgi:hypothetical protein
VPVDGVGAKKRRNRIREEPKSKIADSEDGKREQNEDKAAHMGMLKHGNERMIGNR